MSNLKALLLQIRYPYTAGVLALLWLSTALLLVIEPSLPLKELVVLVALASCFVAVIGFSNPKR